MDIFKFQYTDAKNKVSSRRVVVMQKPTDKVHGLEVREMGESELFELCKDMKQLTKMYEDKLAEILQKHDLTYNRRMFFPDKMEGLEVEKVF